MITDQDTKKLAGKLLVVNKVHAHINFIVPQLDEIFADFVGKKVINTKNQLLPKIENIIDEKFQKIKKSELQFLPELIKLDNHEFHVERVLCYASSGYSSSLVWEFYSQVNGESYQKYSKEISIGEITDQKLISIRKFNPLRDDYTLDEVKQLHINLVEAKKAYDDAKRNIYPFDEIIH